jgi:NAD(P)-dependent dehydrogenase (short-subunit alcohol dehydrogenase family)
VSDALLVGGRSEIGRAIVRRPAAQRVWLLGRDRGRLVRATAELNGAASELRLVDADDIPSHRQAIERAFAPGPLRLIFAILRHLPRETYRRLPL